MWNLERYKNKVCVITDDRKYTYDDLNNLQNELAKHLDSRALTFIICENTFESLLGYVATIKNKAVPLMLSKCLPDEKYIELIQRYMPKYIWCNISVSIKAIISISDKISVLYTYREYTLYRISYEQKGEQDNIYDELALLLSTSGSTGSPKYVRISYKNLRSNTQAIVDCLKITNKDVTIVTLPMNYTYGLSVINTYLYVGATIIFTEDSILKSSFWDKLIQFEVTSISGVPYTYDVLKKLRLDKRKLPYLRVLTQAGGKLSSETRRYLIDYCERENKKLIVMYGQTEATARMSYMPYEKLKEKEESVGIPIPQGRLWIVDKNGKEVTDAYIEGEIVYEGDNVMLGYAMSQKDLAKENEKGKVLYTGDYGYFDEDNYLYIKERKDRQVKLFGSRIDLMFIEDEITKRYGGECICVMNECMIYIYHTVKNVETEVCSLINKLLIIPHKNIRYCCVDELPKINEGKVIC